MTKELKDYANISVSITPFSDHSIVTLWVREPGGTLRRFGEHRSWIVDLRRDQVDQLKPEDFLILFYLALQRKLEDLI